MKEGFVFPCEYKKFKHYEKNYAMHDLELETTIHGLKIWRYYLLGRIFELRMDHMSLKYLFNQPSLKSKQARRLEFLCEFDFEIRHVKGKENKVADALSKKIHVETMSICKSNLRTRVIEVSNQDELYLQIKEKQQQGKLEKSVKDISKKKRIFLFLKADYIFQIV